MCWEIWYHYTCGHIKSGEAFQERYEHCDDWTAGQEEESCPNFDPNQEHESRDEDQKCPECQYMTPPSSAEPSSEEEGGGEEEETS